MLFFCFKCGNKVDSFTDLEPLVLLALCVQVVQVEDVDHLLLLEEELLDLAGDDGGRAAGLGKANLNLSIE